MTKNKKGKVNFSSKIFLVAAIALVLVGAGGLVKSKTDLGELFVQKLADKVSPETLLAALGLGVSFDEELGLTTIASANTGLTNLRIAGVLQMGSSSSTSKYLVTQYDVEDWPSGTSSVRFTNNRSTTSTVNRVVINGTGTDSQVVSSTFIISCGNVNANPNYAYNSAQGTRPGGFIDAARFATGSQPYYDSIVTSTADKVLGTTQLSPALIGPNEHFDCLAQANGVASSVQCAGDRVSCEAVTSTNRGWEANVVVEWNFVDE